MSVEPPRFYEFGVFQLDRVERQLLRRGTAVPVASKSIEVLLLLVEDAGRVLERGELTRRIWPDAEGAEGSLAVTISALRKTLGDRPDGGLYIETIPRQGYRFAARVTVLPEGAEPPSQSVAGAALSALRPDELTRFPAGTDGAFSGLAIGLEQCHDDQNEAVSSASGKIRLTPWVEITGETLTEDILGQIFSTFCIGK